MILTSHQMRFLRLVVMLVSVLTCGRNKGPTSAKGTIYNGFLCKACKAKFYTDSDVYADFCPQCKSVDVQVVGSYVCAADQHLTIGPRNRGGLACEQCGAVVMDMHLPVESELKPWGAVRKSKSEVSSR
jgi:hypothetical protein